MSATLIGMGNIGSHLAPLVARMPGMKRMTLVDFDTYEEKNLTGQDIEPGDVDKPKVEVQARRLRRMAPALEIDPIVARLEDVPLGRLRADVLLAGLDSRVARRRLNRLAWRLGVPWIDGGVDGAGLLVRVNAYAPGPDASCLECGWDPADYEAAALEQPYPCDPEAGSPAATNAPSSVGAVTAGLMAVECHKQLGGDAEHFLRGRQVLMDLRNHTHYLTRFDRAGDCRFDHQAWAIERLDDPPGKLSVTQAIRLAAGGARDCSGWWLGLEGQTFVRRQYCANCQAATSDYTWLTRRIPASRRRCATCGGALTVRGFDMVERLDWSDLEPPERRRSLRSLGFQPGDVVSIGGAGVVRHFELGGSR